MKKMKSIHSFLPPYILEEMKKNGKVKISQEHLDADNDFREKRASKSGPMTAAPQPPSSNGERKVYDCKNRTPLRKNLARSEGGAPVADQIVNAAYDNAGTVRDFYKNQYNWLSVDNKGAALILNVHYSTNYNNAFWDGDEMVFGDGDGVVFISFAKSLDVTGHELTHGVVQYTANLVYSKQPGALNEHMADVFGVTIRQFKEGQTSDPANANWLVGDSIMGPTLQGQAIRNMKAPGTAYDNVYMGQDPQPDNMANYYSGSSDNYGVHINSGIPNKVFYLVSVAFGDTLKAANLWFETLKTMTSSTDFAGFKAKTLAKTSQLITAGKLPADAVTLVTDSFAVVGL